MRVFSTIAWWLFVLLIPLFLFTTTMRWGVGELRLYQYDFDKYGISQRTGIEDDELIKAARELIHYFNSDEESIHITVTRGGADFVLFNEREVAHLRDVKGLIQLGYRIQEATFIYLAIYALAIFLRDRKRLWRKLMKPLMWGAGLTIAIMLALGIGTLFNFEQLFIQFHMLSFTNTLWQLDPSRDYLIMMFPEGFFRDAAMFGAMAITIEAVILGSIAAWLMAVNPVR